MPEALDSAQPTARRRRRISPLRLRLLALVAIAFFPLFLLVVRLANDERRATTLRERDASLRLLDVLPTEARAAAKPLAQTLAHLSPKLAERLEVSDEGALPAVAGEARARLHEALTDWFCEVSKQQQLVMLIDDLERADEASVAWLLTLGMAAERRNLMIVVAYNSDSKQEPSAAMRQLLQQGRRVLLRPLDGSAAREPRRAGNAGARAHRRAAARKPCAAA